MRNKTVFNFKLWFSLFSFTFLLFTVCGCNESLQTATGAALVQSLIPQATEIIRVGLIDKDPRIRAKAIEVVADTQQIKLMPAVQRLLKDDFVPVRFSAALAVGDTGYSLAKRQLKQLLNDPDENVRIAATYALDKLGAGNSFKALRKAAASKDQTVRANAVVLLGKSGDKRVLKLLYQILKDEDSGTKVRLQTVEAIARLGDEEILPKLWAIVLSVYADDRAIGIKAMGALGTPKARDILITKLDDDVLEVRLIAAEQLGLLGDTTGQAQVLDVFNKKVMAGLRKEEHQHVNMLTALAIGEIRTPALTKFLPKLLKNESKRVRIAAAKAVFRAARKD